MRRRRTTTHEIDFALPLISGEYLNVVLPGQTHRVPEQAVGWAKVEAQPAVDALFEDFLVEQCVKWIRYRQRTAPGSACFWDRAAP